MKSALGAGDPDRAIEAFLPVADIVPEEVSPSPSPTTTDPHRHPGAA